MNIYSASRQWAERPQDERFNSLEEMHAATKDYAERAYETDRPWAELRASADGDEVFLVGKAGVGAKIANYAFKQLAARVGAPASYLAQLPPTLAAQNLNFGLKARAAGVASLLFHHLPSSDGQRLLLRAVTTEKYERVWNHEVIARLVDLSNRHALVPGQTTRNAAGVDLYGRPAKALYASDHDMFAFLMSPDRVEKTPVGTDMFRGLIVSNSEVGARKLRVQSFRFVEVCENHIIWDVENLLEVALVHVGEVNRRWLDAQVTIRKYLDAPSGLASDTARFAQFTARIAATKAEVLDLLFGKGVASRKTLEAGYDAVVPAEDGDARTPWGIVSGLTRASQKSPYADDRYEADKAAAKVLSLKF